MNTFFICRLTVYGPYNPHGSRYETSEVAGLAYPMRYGVYGNKWWVEDRTSLSLEELQDQYGNSGRRVYDTMRNQRGEIVDLVLMQNIVSAVHEHQGKHHGNEYYIQFNADGTEVDHIITPDFRTEVVNIHNYNRAHLDGLLGLVCDVNYEMLSAIQTTVFAADGIDAVEKTSIGTRIAAARDTNAEFCAIIEKDLFADAVIMGLNGTSHIANFISEHHQGEIFAMPGRNAADIVGANLRTFKDHINLLLEPTLALLEAIPSVQVRGHVGKNLRVTMELRSGTTWLTPERLAEVAQRHITDPQYAPSAWPGDVAING